MQIAKKFKQLFCILIAGSLVLLGACGSPEPSKERTNSYINPVFAPVFADPCIIRGDDGFFYAYATEDFGCYNEQDKIACIPIIKSQDLVKWEYVGDVFPEKPDWGMTTAGAWAPDIVKIGDKYNLYYSLSIWNDPNPAICVATADHPAGPWEDQGKIFDSLSVGVNNSIDSFTFEYEGGVYMIWGSFRGLYMIELTSDGLAVKDIASKALIGGTEDSSSFEAPYMIEREGYYYLFLSLGHCCLGIDSTYYVNVVRSKSPFGPWVDREGRTILNKQTLGELVVKGGIDVTGPGHNSVIRDDDGEYWMVYHGYEVKYTLGTYGSSPRRSLFIDKLLWDDDGFPYINEKVPSYQTIEAPKIKR